MSNYLFEKYCSICGQWPTHKAGCPRNTDWSKVRSNIRKENEIARKQRESQKPTRKQMQQEFDQ